MNATRVRVYYSELSTTDGFTTNVLRQLSETHRRFMSAPESLKNVADYVDYVKWICRLSMALDALPVSACVSSRPMVWIHGEQACNCIWFEVISASVKAANAVIRESIEFEKTSPSFSQRARMMTECVSPVIAALNYVIGFVFTAWIDNPEDLEEHFTKRSCETMLVLVRAYGFWNKACGEIIDMLPDIEIGKELSASAMNNNRDNPDCADFHFEDLQLRNDFDTGLEMLTGTADDDDDDETKEPGFQLDSGGESAYACHQLLAQLPANIDIFVKLHPTEHKTESLWNPSATALDTSTKILSAREANTIRKPYKEENTWISDAKSRMLVILSYALRTRPSPSTLAIAACLNAAQRNGGDVMELAKEKNRLLSAVSSKRMPPFVNELIRRGFRDAREEFFVSGLDLFRTMPDVNTRDRRPNDKRVVCGLLFEGSTGSQTGHAKEQ